MRIGLMKPCLALLGLAGLLSLGLAAAQDSGPETEKESRPSPQKPEDGKAIQRVSLKVARDRARLMHEIYSATLMAMHHRYFHGDRAVVPARALKDVFQDMERKNGSQGRWISASLSPMSIDHKPETTFEKHAARQIAKGEEFVETIEDGYFRQAGSISLGGGCLNCHAGSFRNTSASAKFAGLVISIPVEPGEKLAE